MSEYLNGLRSLLRSARAHYATQTPLWPLCVIWEAVSFTWWRGVYWPVSARLNIIFWYFGWFGRWKARVGDVILVHDTPNTVRAIDHRALTVTTDSGVHSRPQCCDPWEAPC